MPALSRHVLPQIPMDKLQEFESFLNKHGVECERTRRPTSWFVPIQKEYNAEKVNNIAKDPGKLEELPVISTHEGYLVDGHHRWLAAQKIHKDDMDTVICRAPLKKIIRLAHEFEPSYTKTVREFASYAILPILFENKQELMEYIRKYIRRTITEQLMPVIDDPEDLVSGDPMVTGVTEVDLDKVEDPNTLPSGDPMVTRFKEAVYDDDDTGDGYYDPEGLTYDDGYGPKMRGTDNDSATTNDVPSTI